MNSIKQKLLTFVSKKLAAIVGAFLATWLNRKFDLGLTDADITKLIAAVIAYVLGQTGLDIVAVRTPSAPNPPSIGEIDYPQGDGSIVDAPAPLN